MYKRKLNNFFTQKIAVFALGFFLTLFLLPQISFGQEVSEPPEISELPQEATIHTTLEGGDWNNPNTWLENRLPEEEDFVEISSGVSISSDYEIYKIEVTETGFLESTNDNFITSQGIIINRGTIDASVFLKTGGGFHNSGIYNGTITPFGDEYQEFSGTGNAELYLSSDLYLKSNLTINKLRTRGFSLHLEQSNIEIGLTNLEDGLHIPTGGHLVVTDLGSLKGQDITVETLNINGAVESSIENYYVADFIINAGALLNYQLQYPKSIYFYGNLLNDGSINGRMVLCSYANLTNNGVLNIENITLFSELTRSLSGLEDMKVVLSDDILLENNTLSLSVLFPHDHHLDFVNSGFIKVRNIVGQNGNGFYTNGDLVMNQQFGVDHGYRYPIMSLGTLGANRLFIDDTIHFFTDLDIIADVIVNSGSVFQSYSNYNNQIIDIRGSFINNGTVSNSQKMYIHKNIENNGEWNDPRGRIGLGWQDTPENQFEFQIANSTGGLGDTISLTDNYFYRDTRTYPFPKNVSEMTRDGDIKYWRSRNVGGEWSDIHSINIPLYLEDNLTFFTVSEIFEAIENTEVEITIDAEDADYSGILQLFSGEGGVVPSEVSMENGTATLGVSFDTVSEGNVLSVVSGNLSGTSNEFSVVSAENPNFFVVSDIPDTREGRDFIVTITAEDPSHSGTLEVIHSGGLVIPDIEMVDGRAELHLRFSNPSDHNVLTVSDKMNSHLSGTSNEFIITKKSSGGGSSSNDDEDESNEDEEDGEGQSPSPPDDEIIEDDSEGDEEETEEPEYKLENECLSIQSIYSVLSRSLHSELKSIPDEKQNVRNLQQKLKDLNFLDGGVDGDFGPDTERALKDFQEQNGLGADGIFGNTSSNFIQTNCNSLEDKVIPDPEPDEIEEEQDNSQEEEEDTSVDNTGEWLENIWDGLGNWFNGLFGGNGYIITSGEMEGPELPKPDDEYITKEMLKQAFNIDVDQEVVNEINRLFPPYEIDTIERQSHFLGQVAHESELKPVEENGRYSMEFIYKNFSYSSYPKFYNNPSFYEKNRERILNYLYRNRLGNGDEESGDGFRYRGRGLIQLTGKSNYQSYAIHWNSDNKSDVQDFVINPNLLLENRYGTGSAFYFWESRNINQVANESNVDSIKSVTKKVNGGSIGLQDRINKFNSIYQILTNI